jgi:transcriptional regulator with XRE-family HTH domain
MSFHTQRRAAFAARLKKIRRKSGLSASAAAELIRNHGLACSRGTLLAWERGQGTTSREPFASDLSILAAVFNCRIEDFFGGDAEADPPHVQRALDSTNGTSM